MKPGIKHKSLTYEIRNRSIFQMFYAGLSRKQIAFRVAMTYEALKKVLAQHKKHFPRHEI